MQTSIAVYFSPRGGIEKQLLALIDSAKENVELAAYAFTSQDLANSLLAAIKRGVNVTIVFDRWETRGPQAAMHDTLEKGGATIRLISPAGGIMHNKFLIVDRTRVEWGSYNYTDRAENVNYENATITTDPRLAEEYYSHFQSIYNQATPEARGAQRPVFRLLRRLASPFKRRR